MKRTTDFTRQIEFAIKGLEVLKSLASNELLIQPDLMVGGSPRKKVFADTLGELIDLSVQLTASRHARAKDVSTQRCISQMNDDARN